MYVVREDAEKVKSSERNASRSPSPHSVRIKPTSESQHAPIGKQEKGVNPRGVAATPIWVPKCPARSYIGSGLDLAAGA